jgi:hypothetical protein
MIFSLGDAVYGARTLFVSIRWEHLASIHPDLVVLLAVSAQRPAFAAAG